MNDPEFEISVEELARCLHDGADWEVLDVRESWEREICAIPGSRHVPLGQLPVRIGEIPRDKTIAVVCHHGYRSARATEWLQARGFKAVVNLMGGIDAWARRIDAGMQTY